ncbi:MAG: efflux RND transporter periplasmic adaptor subunit [Bacteroidaceae bacterium]|nr:efflux RND transporter periplasmic adaptor subunit [Bacteroidaceae bacterium]
MDIQLPKKPWYVRYLYHMVGGVIFVAFIIYTIIIVLSPKQMRVYANELELDTVCADRFLEYIDVEGIVQPFMQIRINSKEEGTVEHIMVEDGTMVHKGDTILMLSNSKLLREIDEELDAWLNQQRLFREQEIEMEQKSIMLKEQTLDTRHELLNLDKNLQISREEYRMGIKSKAELEMADEDYKYRKEKMMLKMKSLHHDSIATHIKRDMMDAQRMQYEKKHRHSEKRIEGLVVTAPMDGQVSYVRVTLGERVYAGTQIADLKVLSKYKIHTSISEHYIDRVTNNQPATVNYQDTTYPLHISRVVPEVKDRNFDVDLVFTADMPLNLRVGKTFRVQIELGQPEKSIVIHRGAFYQATSGEWIYKLTKDGKRAVKVPIEVGRQNPMQYEVTSGLKPGDVVIVNSYDNYADVEQLVIK